MRVPVLFWLLMALLYCVLSTKEVLTSQYCVDTSTNSDDDNPLGSSEYIYTQRGDGDIRAERNALIFFQIFEREGGIIPDNATIDNATLVMHLNHKPDPDASLWKVKKEWDEMTTYDSFGGTPLLRSQFVSPGIPLASPDDLQLVVDITTFVQDWANGTIVNRGMIFVQGTGLFSKDWKFLSCDYGTDNQRPYLAIEYTEAVPLTNQPTVSPTTLPPVPPSFDCFYYRTADFDSGSQYQNPLSAFSNVCVRCVSDTEIPGGYMVDPSSITMNEIPVLSVQTIENSDSEKDTLKSCFIVPKIELVPKRTEAKLRLRYMPNNDTLEKTIEYSPSLPSVLDCQVFRCENGSTVIEGDLVVTTPFHTTVDIIIAGNFTVSSAGNWSLLVGTKVSVMGCADISGTLQVNIDQNTSPDGTYTLVSGDCIESNVDNFVLNVKNQDPCIKRSASQNRTPRTLSAVITSTDTCGNEDNDIFVWLIPTVVVAAIIAILVATLGGYYGRKWYHARAISKVEMAFQSQNPSMT